MCANKWLVKILALVTNTWNHLSMYLKSITTEYNN